MRGASPPLTASASLALFFSSQTHTEGSTSAQPLDIKLYQYDVCPFCCKVKAFLDFKGIPYEAIEVNPLTKGQLKEVTDYNMVPYAVINGEGVTQSAGIIDHISKLTGEVVDLEENERQWINWVDDKLVHILPANIYRTAGESLQSFDYISGQSNFTESQKFMAKYSGAVLMYLITNLKLKKKYGIEDGREREHLYDAVAEWLAVANADGNKFLGGDQPNLADVSVFGVLRSLEGYDTFGDLMANTGVEPWYASMQEKVGGPSRVN